MGDESTHDFILDRRRVLKFMGASALAAGLAPELLARTARASPERPADILMQEHGVILSVRNAASDEVRRMRRDGKVNTERVLRMIEFFREFGDRCHHGKEEDMYFPAAVERDGKRIREIVDRMEKEHVIFRGLLSSAADAAQDGAAPETAEYLDVYVNMLFRHIEIENKQLFKEIDFSQETRRELLRRFRRFENEELGEGFHEKYRNMAKELVAG